MEINYSGWNPKAAMERAEARRQKNDMLKKTLIFTGGLIAAGILAPLALDFVGKQLDKEFEAEAKAIEEFKKTRDMNIYIP